MTRYDFRKDFLKMKLLDQGILKRRVKQLTSLQDTWKLFKFNEDPKVLKSLPKQGEEDLTK